MVRFIKVISTVDKITDCIPGVATVKNAGILLYQRAHKVNSVAKHLSGTTSWKDDIKIHMLSKDQKLALFAMHPIGSHVLYFKYLSDFSEYIVNSLTKKRNTQVDDGYLLKALSMNNKEHRNEVIALYLARNPNQSDEKLMRAFHQAAQMRTNNPEDKAVFDLIFNSRQWSSDSIVAVLKNVTDIETAQTILNKYKTTLSPTQAGSVLEAQGLNKDVTNDLIKLILDAFPNIDKEAAGKCLQNVNLHANYFYQSPENEKKCLAIIQTLFDRFPGIEDEFVDAAITHAGDAGYKDVLALLVEKKPHLIDQHLAKLTANAAKRGDAEIFHWLLGAYKDKISTQMIGQALASTIKGFYGAGDKQVLLIKEKLLKEYPNLPGKDLEPVLEQAAQRNIKYFSEFLNHFQQLKPENLQNLLECATRYSQSKDPSEVENWSRISRLILQKFPDMKPQRGP